jgi:hypothetical protein
MSTALRPLLGRAKTFLPPEKKFFLAHWGDCLKDQGGSVHEGIYIPRRDTPSALQAFAGGRLFPGAHHVATFEVNEHNDEFQWTQASKVFASGAMVCSATDKPDCCDGLELHRSQWLVSATAAWAGSRRVFSIRWGHSACRHGLPREDNDRN